MRGRPPSRRSGSILPRPPRRDSAGSATPTPLDSMLLAQISIANGRDDEALALLSQVPDDHVAAPQARLLAGQVELRRHRARFAERYLRQAIQLDPKLVQAHKEMIYILGFQLRRADLNAEFLASPSSRICPSRTSSTGASCAPLSGSPQRLSQSSCFSSKLTPTIAGLDWP